MADSKFVKPNWYSEADVEAAPQGWIYTKNYDEVLVAIPHLDVRIAAEFPVAPLAPTMLIDTIAEVVDPVADAVITLTGKITPPVGAIPGVVTVTVEGQAPYTAVVNASPTTGNTYVWTVAGVPVDELLEGNTLVSVKGTSKDSNNASNVSVESAPVTSNIVVTIS